MKNLIFPMAILFISCQNSTPTNLKQEIPFQQIDISQIYLKNCSQCHGTERTGISAPALIPETISKFKQDELVQIILHGRQATQMPGFENKMTENEIAQLAKYLTIPTKNTIQWTETEIEQSRKIEDLSILKKPVFSADPWNLFFVVSHGDHGLTILDGDHFTVLKTFNMRPGIHGGIKYTNDGRRAFAMTRDGWLTAFDVYGMKIIGEIRLAINTRNIAISEDGKTLVAANVYPQNLVFVNIADLKVQKVIPLDGLPSAVYTAFGRKRFSIAFKDLAKIIEFDQNFENKTTIEIQQPLEDFMFDPTYQFAIGTNRKSNLAQVIDLKKKEVIKTFNVEGFPHLGSGIAFTSEKKVNYLVLPNMREGLVTFINTKNWEISKQVKTSGPGFFLRTHENTDYIFADSFLSSAKDELHIISKKNQKLLETLKPFPGKTFAHTEFSKNGKYALASIWDEDGAIIVFDVKTLKEVKRIAMKKPSGKYNIFNKTHLSLGTSH